MEDPDLSSQAETGDSLPNLLFVPGIEHEDGDLDALRLHLSSLARIVTVHKEEVGFTAKERNQWEEKLQRALCDTAERHNAVGVIGHSFGCFRTLRLLENGVRMEFSVLLNPPANEIDKSRFQKNAFPLITVTDTERRLFPLIQDLNDKEYAAFIMRHARYELNGDNPLRPWHSTEFKSLLKDIPFPELLRHVQPDIPVDIIHSPTDPWDIRDWGDIGMHINKHAIDHGGHYLATSYPDKVSTVIRGSLERIVGIPQKPKKAVAAA